MGTLHPALWQFYLAAAVAGGGAGARKGPAVLRATAEPAIDPKQTTVTTD